MKSAFIIMKNYILKNGKAAIIILALALSIVITISSTINSLQTQIYDKLVNILSFDYKVVTNKSFDQELYNKIKNLEGVEELYPLQETSVLLNSEGYSLLVNKREIPFDILNSPRFTKSTILLDNIQEDNALYISIPLANKILLNKGDLVSLSYINNKKRIDKKELKVSSMFATNQSLFDGSYILVNINKNDIEKTSYGVYSSNVKANIKELEDQGYKITTLESDFSPLVGALTFEKTTMNIFLVIMLIIILLFIYQMLKRFFKSHSQSLSIFHIFGIDNNWIYFLGIIFTIIVTILTFIFALVFSFLFVYIVSQYPLFKSIKIEYSYASMIYYSIFMFMTLLVLSIMACRSFKKQNVLEAIYGKKY